MAEGDIGKTEAGSISSKMKEWEISARLQDGPGDDKETTWINQDWTKYHAYYKEIPEVRRCLDAKATWAVGRGIFALLETGEIDEQTTLVMMKIRGWGKDTFNNIMENMIKTYHIGGDAFAEIIRDDEGNLINLKPLDPSSIRIVVNRAGLLLRYEQVSKVDKKGDKKVSPEKIFHLARNRIVDEIHGVSAIESVEWIIKAKQQALTDWAEMLRKNVHPITLWKLATNTKSKIKSFLKMVTTALRAKGDHLAIPEDVVEHEIAAIPQNATLNALPTLDYYDDKFYETFGVPRVIVGNSKNLTDAASKTAYLTFEQDVREEQLFIKEQVLQQLGMMIEMEMPAELENEMLSDTRKDAGDMAASRPNETTSELEGKA